MGFLSFGKSKQKESGSSSEEFNRQAPEWQIPYQQQGLSQAQNLLNRGAFQGYGGAANAYGQAGAGITPGLQSGYDYYNQLLQPGSGFLDQYQTPMGLDPNVMQSAINNPVINQQIAAGTADIQSVLNDNIAQVKADATQGGGSASSWRGLLEGRAIGDAARAVGNLSAGLRGQGYGYGVGAAQQANQALQAAQMQDWLTRQQAAQNITGLGQQGLGYTQQAADLRAMEYGLPMDLLQQYWQIVGNPLGEQGTASSQYKGKQKGSSFGGQIGF
jgi:hypothetical protein